MKKTPETSNERLAALSQSLAAVEAQVAVPKSRPIAPKAKVTLGPRTSKTLWLMTWGFRLLWLLWVALFFATSPAKSVSDLWAIPFSAVVCWLIYQGHKHIIIASVRTATKRKRSV